jgi:hypothetical protein
MKFPKLLLIFNTVFIFFLPLVVNSQVLSVFLDGYQNAPHVNWQEINTKRFRIIFPSTIYPDAERVANSLEHVYDSVAKTLYFKPHKMTLFMTNQTTISNGFVAIVPRYSQWFSTPPQIAFGGASDWYNLLASHETRHMVQIDKFRDLGWNRIIHVFFGQTVFSIVMNFSVPGWYFEGDAVGTETALTSAGRGRLPEFNRDIRTILLSGKKYSYTKACMNSLKDYYPGIYELGYLMTTHVKRNYGPAAWSKILEMTARWEFVPGSFSIASKKKIGISNRKIYTNTMSEVQKLWKEQSSGLKFTEGKIINRKNKTAWTNYEYPQYASDGSVICLKYGKDDIIKIIRLDKKGNEKFLCYGPQSSDIPFRLTGNFIIWNEFIPDPRWGQKDESKIRIYDMKSSTIRDIRTVSNVFSPVISPDCKYIATVEFTPERKCQLLIIDFISGNEVKRFENLQNEYIELPSWSADSKKIACCKISRDHGKCLEILDVESGNTRIILPYSFENFSQPIFSGNYIFYNSPFSGIDNIYAVDTLTSEIFQVTSGKFGIYHPCIPASANTIVFDDYSIQGRNIMEMPIIPDSFISVKNVSQKNDNYWNPLVKQESGGDIFKNIPEKNYEASKFKPWLHLFNIHSWSVFPSWTTPSSTAYTINSLNFMNTMLFRVSYERNQNEKTNSVFINESYAGFYPVIDFGGNLGGRVSTFKDAKDSTQYYHWQEKSVYSGLRLPLNFSRNVHSRFLTFGVNASYTETGASSVYDRNAKNNYGKFFPLTYQANYTSLIQGERDFNPKWGQNINIIFKHTPFKGDYRGTLFSGQLDLYFPGLIKHHSLFLQFAEEIQEPGNYTFASQMLFPRGYAYVFHKNIYKTGLNYGFPVWYPDIHLGQVINFRQVRINLFDDYASASPDLYNSKTITYHSAGAEIAFSINLFLVPIPVEIGFRLSQLFNEDKLVPEFVLFGYGL